MNIKMNRNLANLKFVKKLYVSPTGTDDSLCVGACYYLNKNFKQKPLKNIYLGQNISDNEMTTIFNCGIGYVLIINKDFYNTIKHLNLINVGYLQ